MKKLHLWGAACAYLVWMSTAQAVTIDFESMMTSPLELVANGTQYYEDGFVVRNGNSDTDPIYGAADGWNNNIGSSNGTVTAVSAGDEGSDFSRFTLFSPENVETVTLETLFSFSLSSIDLGEFVKNGSEFEIVVADSVLVTGHLSGGGTVSTTLNLDLLSDGNDGVADFQTFSFDPTWTDLLFVEFYATRQVHDLAVTGVSFDNIVVSTVPIPPAAWLFGSGLLGLIGVARRKKAA